MGVTFWVMSSGTDWSGELWLLSKIRYDRALAMGLGMVLEEVVWRMDVLDTQNDDRDEPAHPFLPSTLFHARFFSIYISVSSSLFNIPAPNRHAQPFPEPQLPRTQSLDLFSGFFAIFQRP
jgi:hypothetical protein